MPMPAPLSGGKLRPTSAAGKSARCTARQVLRGSTSDRRRRLFGAASDCLCAMLRKLKRTKGMTIILTTHYL